MYLPIFDPGSLFTSLIPYIFSLFCCVFRRWYCTHSGPHGSPSFHLLSFSFLLVILQTGCFLCLLHCNLQCFLALSLTKFICWNYPIGQLLWLSSLSVMELFTTYYRVHQFILLYTLRSQDIILQNPVAYVEWDINTLWSEAVTLSGASCVVLCVSFPWWQFKDCNSSKSKNFLKCLYLNSHF